MGICVMGSGDFGRALAGRLAASGYPVNIASRNPDKNRSLIPSGVEVSGLSSAACADLIIAAVPMDFYHTLPANLLKGKVVVDVSNRSTINAKTTESQAEQLARLLPESSVVKSFNVLSAHSLESGGMQGSKQVFVAGDDVFARDLVSGVVRGAGFTPVDLGCLSAARTIEDIPVAVFPQWRVPFYIHLSIFTFIYILGFVKIQICWPITWSADGKFLWHLWNHIPMDSTNKALAVHALTTLALCYLPGVLAGWLQIYRGTKYSRFPAWLDNWLKMRKQLGLLMLFAASIHACLSVAYMSPTYQGLVYGDPVEASAHVMEGVCLRAEWLRVDSSCLPLCSRHVLWLALHEWSKLWDSIFLPVRALHTIPDHPDEAAHGLASPLHPPGQDQGRLCQGSQAGGGCLRGFGGFLLFLFVMACVRTCNQR